MKKSELRQLIKPLVKECIQEVLIEEGYLSSIVSEVAKGMQTQLVVETKELPPEIQKPAYNSNNKKLHEYRKKMMDAIGNEAYNGVNLFEGTDPMTNSEARTPSNGSVDLGNPNDSGVDISSLMGSASKIWDAMK